MELNEMKLNRQIDERSSAVVRKFMSSKGFANKKIADTPTDSYQLVNRRYATLNGPTASRPTSSVVGQSYLDTTLASGRGKPVWWNGIGWVDATGTYV